MKLNTSQHAFFALVEAGLWEHDVHLSQFDSIDFKEVYRLAEEQSVVGLVAAGLEHVIDLKIPKEDVLQFAGNALQLEQRNKSMDDFIGRLFARMNENDIYSLLVKGQGIAQCYERPLWRASGDVDLFFDADNFEKASSLLPSFASSLDENRPEIKHFAMTINGWEVELHGTLRSQLGRRIDRVIDSIQADTFNKGKVRVWHNGDCDIFLPSANNDVILIFVHILQHLFRGGIGLRQLCDLCRLLWKYRDSIDVELLRYRLFAMGLETEWKTFASLAVHTFGMPIESMPLYNSSKCWERKANKVLHHIYETGSFGHNRDSSYLSEAPVLIRRMISFWRYTSDNARLFLIFPQDSIRVWALIVNERIKVALRRDKS